MPCSQRLEILNEIPAFLVGDRSAIVVTGVRIPTGDHRALALALRELADDPERRREMGHEARRRSILEFSRETQIESIARILEGTVG